MIMPELFSDEMRRDPYPAYEQMRRHSPVLYVPPFDLWMIFAYEDVKWALSDPDTFSSRYGPEWLIFFDPPRHTQLRALILRAFTPRSVANLEPRIRQLSRELLDQVIERGQMDLAADFSVLLPMIVIAEMLGIPVADLPRFQRWSDVILNMSYTIWGRGEAGRAANQEFVAATAEMNDYLTDLLPERRAAPRDDLLTRVVQAEVDGERLTQQEILGFFQLLLVAGQETTTNLINNAILCFLENPGTLARLRERIDLLPSAIEEVLRYRSPLQWIGRVTRREVRMHGQVIPAGKLVLTIIGSANRDPQPFPDPDRLDITRDPNPHLAFGHSVHFCLGAPLARLEAKIALSELLGRLKGLAFGSSEPWEPRKALHVHGPARLPIRFEAADRHSDHAPTGTVGS
jgi:cytochrome P450